MRALMIGAFLASAGASVATRDPWFIVACVAFGIAAIAKGARS